MEISPLHFSGNQKYQQYCSSLPSHHPSLSQAQANSSSWAGGARDRAAEGAGFLSLGPREILPVGPTCAPRGVHSILDLCLPLDASSIPPPRCHNQKCLQTLSMCPVPWGAKLCPHPRPIEEHSYKGTTPWCCGRQAARRTPFAGPPWVFPHLPDNAGKELGERLTRQPGSAPTDSHTFESLLNMKQRRAREIGVYLLRHQASFRETVPDFLTAILGSS